MERHKLYDGAVALAFDPRRHTYQVDGRFAPSVTGITGTIDKSDALIGWALREASAFVRASIQPGVPLDEVAVEAVLRGMKTAHKDSLNRAADIGKVVHSWVEEHISAKLDKSKAGPKPPTNPMVANGVNAFLAWEDAHSVTYHHTERKIYSRQHHYAGTVDMVADINGVLTVGDIKTGSGIYPEFHLQVAAYKAALIEEMDIPIEARLLIHLDKKSGEFTPHPINGAHAYAQDLAAFLALRQVYRRMRGA